MVDDFKPTWGMDKFGRWRSRTWLAWVRELRCSESGVHGDVVAAHFRTACSGIGAKPDDFLVYPLSDRVHKRYHQEGHPDHADQWRWTTAVILRMLNRGALAGDSASWVRRMADPSEPPTAVWVERISQKWRRLFAAGELRLDARIVVPF